MSGGAVPCRSMKPVGTNDPLTSRATKECAGNGTAVLLAPTWLRSLLRKGSDSGYGARCVFEFVFADSKIKKMISNYHVMDWIAHA